MLPSVTVSGRLTADPELRFIPSGKAVASFTVAASERRKNKQTEEWEDGDKSFIRCTVWEQIAENVAESLVRGDQVVVIGRLFQREYETREGEKRTSVELKVDTIAATIAKNTSVKVNRAQRGSDAAPQGDSNSDPWGSSSSSVPDEPPF